MEVEDMCEDMCSFTWGYVPIHWGFVTCNLSCNVEGSSCVLDKLNSFPPQHGLCILIINGHDRDANAARKPKNIVMDCVFCVDGIAMDKIGLYNLSYCSDWNNLNGDFEVVIVAFQILLQHQNWMHWCWTQAESNEHISLMEIQYYFVLYLNKRRCLQWTQRKQMVSPNSKEQHDCATLCARINELDIICLLVL